MMFSARTRRIAVMAVAVLAVFIMLGRAYRWIAPHASRRSAAMHQPSPSTDEAGVERYQYFCTDVTDGDTIVVSSLGPVRLIGIDTPEMNYDLGVPQPFAEEAREFCKRLVLRRTVSLEFDVEKRDKYGRALAYVFVGDDFVNAELVKAGLARASNIPPDDRYRDELKRLERDARTKRLGRWGH
ncbi:MAG: thermonuclease family protein [Candidatus Coatesbacteria bacterium]|nr:thermonuclease family protein [Candidatus Coatesbacteria bacterium]